MNAGPGLLPQLSGGVLRGRHILREAAGEFEAFHARRVTVDGQQPKAAAHLWDDHDAVAVAIGIDHPGIGVQAAARPHAQVSQHKVVRGVVVNNADRLPGSGGEGPQSPLVQTKGDVRRLNEQIRPALDQIHILGNRVHKYSSSIKMISISYTKICQVYSSFRAFSVQKVQLA